ncbi:hypothetical protein GCM10009529_13200 [Micropruina glycogenica]
MLSYPPRRWGDMLTAAALAIRAEVAIRRHGVAGAARVGGLQLAMDGAAAPVASPTEAGLTDRELEQLDIAWRMLRWGPFNGTCLRRAVVGGYFLRHHEPLLRIGVTKIDGKVAAHAWVEVGAVGLDPDGAAVYRVLVTPEEVQG